MIMIAARFAGGSMGVLSNTQSISFPSYLLSEIRILMLN